MLIQSPGKLPGAVTLDNIRNHRFSRNPTIARVFSAFDWVRELNEGVDKIFQEMDEAGLPAPEYENDNDYYLKLVLKNNLTQRVPRLRDDRTANVGNHDGNVGNHVGNHDGNVGNYDGNPAANVGNHVGNTKIQLNETEEKVLELVIEDQSLSAQRISEILGVGKRQTERTLKSLREKGLIFREGGTRGFWKILEVPQDQ
ncbi:MAG: ATP-binding protein [Eggerthellaceae bacterium]|nr:ATP-binding protein [Eggerthellaceae bacterium]